MSWFWSPKESPINEQEDEVLVHSPNNIPANNLVDELKNFHLNKTLSPIPKDTKPKPKKNEVWEEVLENRKRILKLESPDNSKKCIEERVMALEDIVKNLQDTIKRLENPSFEFSGNIKGSSYDSIFIGGKTYIQYNPTQHLAQPYNLEGPVVKEWNGGNTFEIARQVGNEWNGGIASEMYKLG